MLQNAKKDEDNLKSMKESQLHSGMQRMRLATLHKKATNHRFYAATALNLKQIGFKQTFNGGTKSGYGSIQPWDFPITTKDAKATINHLAHNLIWPWSNQSLWIPMRWCHFPPIKRKRTLPDNPIPSCHTWTCHQKGLMTNHFRGHRKRVDPRPPIGRHFRWAWPDQHARRFKAGERLSQIPRVEERDLMEP